MQLEQLQAAYRQGTLSRQDFWQGMQENHLQLHHYCALINQSSQIDRLVITSAGLQVVTCDGITLWWDPTDIRSPMSVALNQGAYEPDEAHLLAKLIEHTHIAIDVGANIGWYTLAWAQRLAPRSGEVIAFEPIPTTYAQLCSNIALNHLTNVRAFSYGLADTSGMATMYVPMNSGTVAASLHNITQEKALAIDCPLQTLDAIVAMQGIEKIDLIKGDVEGAELLVLKGALKTIARDHPIIVLELLRKWSACFGYHPNDVIQLLQTYNYQCWCLKMGELTKIDVIDESTEQTNFFFFNPELHAPLIASIKGDCNARFLHN